MMVAVWAELKLGLLHMGCTDIDLYFVNGKAYVFPKSGVHRGST